MSKSNNKVMGMNYTSPEKLDMESTSSGQHLDMGVASFNYVIVCHGRSKFCFNLD